MLKKNKNVDAGLVNGSVGTVVGFSFSTTNPHELSSIKIQFTNIESPIFIYKESCSFEVLKGIFYTRKQFPLMLAFAITIHKLQGQSLQSVIVDAGETTFGCGMMYVALSRVTTLYGLHIIDLSKGKVQCDQKAIQEYNRLRKLYTPHLGIIEQENNTTKLPQPNMPEKSRKRENTLIEHNTPHKKATKVNDREPTTSTVSNEITVTEATKHNIYEHCQVASVDAEF